MQLQRARAARVRLSVSQGSAYPGSRLHSLIRVAMPGSAASSGARHAPSTSSTDIAPSRKPCTLHPDQASANRFFNIASQFQKPSKSCHAMPPKHICLWRRMRLFQANDYPLAETQVVAQTPLELSVGRLLAADAEEKCAFCCCTCTL